MEHLTNEQFKNYQEMLNLLNNADRTTSLDYGDIAVLYKLAEQLGLISIINSHTNKREQGVSVGEAVVAIAINRCIDPKSKRAFPEWYSNSYLPQLLGISPDNMNSTFLTRCLDYLSSETQLEIYSDITTCLMEEFSLGLESLFYDITSTYMEGENCSIASYGYSRDHRPDKKQINIELIVSREHQFPFFCRSFNGSIPDVKRFPATLETLDKIYPELKVTLIGDQGCSSKKNIKMLLEKKKDFIFGAGPTRFGIHTQDVESKEFTLFSTEELERLNWRNEEYKNYQYKDAFIQLDGNICRIIYYFNPKKALNEKDKREKSLQKIEAEINLLQEKIFRGGYGTRTKAQIKTRLKKIIGKAPFIYKIKNTSSGFSLEVKRDLNRIETLARSFGRFALITSHLKRSAESILKDYRDKDGIEKAFQIIKGTILVRPIWHRLAERVNAHVFICVLAYLLMQLLKYLLKVKINVSVSPNNALEQLHHVKVLCYQFGQNKFFQRTTILGISKTILDFLQIQFTGGP